VISLSEEHYEDFGEEYTNEIDHGAPLKCPYCGSEDIEIIGDTYVCMRCGSVLEEEIIDLRPERREFSPENSLTRRFLPTSPLTNIQPVKLYIQGDKSVTRVMPKDARTRNTLYAMSILNEIASRLHLPRTTKDTVMEYFRRLSMKRSIRRERVPAIVAALIYLASRITGVPRHLDRIAKVSGVKKKDISKAYKMIRSELKLTVPIPDAEKFVISFGRELGLGGETISKAIEIIREAKKKGVSIGRDPAGIAAAALYIACRLMGEKKTQKKVAEIAGVTEVTVRNRYREIIKLLNLDISG